MSQEKYIGMDVHQATISVAVMDASGKLIMECLLETKAATIVEFIQGLHGTLSLTFEEGTSAAWLHDLLNPHVSRLVVRSAKGRPVERWEQERPDRCAKVGRDVTHQPTEVGVPRRAWVTHPQGVGTQLSHHHPRCYQLTRFADDWVITCKSAAEARAALAAATRIPKRQRRVVLYVGPILEFRSE